MASSKKSISLNQLKLKARTQCTMVRAYTDLLEFMSPARIAHGVVESFMTQPTTPEQRTIFLKTANDLRVAMVAPCEGVPYPPRNHLVQAATAVDQYVTARVITGKSLYWVTAAFYQFLGRLVYGDYLRIEQRATFNRALTVIREEFSNRIPDSDLTAHTETMAGNRDGWKLLFAAYREVDLFRIDYLDIQFPEDFDPRQHLPAYTDETSS